MLPLLLLSILTAKNTLDCSAQIWALQRVHGTTYFILGNFRPLVPALISMLLI